MTVRRVERDHDLATAARVIGATSNAVARDLFLVTEDPEGEAPPEGSQTLH